MLNLLNLMILILLFLGILILQGFLSSRNNPWMGLILPKIQFIFSCITLAKTLSGASSGTHGLLPSALITFCWFNVPTVCFLIINWICRKRHSKKNELRKMNIQDLH